MRREFGKLITELAEKDKDIYLLTGDIGFGIFDEFREKYSDRFINMGVREQAMISFASGMALEGLKPYVYTITPFLIERPFEQIKLDINGQNKSLQNKGLQTINVKLVGYADYPTLGVTHAEIDAGWLMSKLESITSYFPKDSQEVRKAVFESYTSNKPAFISLKKDKSL